MDNSIYERILNGELSFKVEDSCPVATKDIAVNLKNRKTAIDSAMYGPLNPSEPNEDYWKKIGEEWDVDVASAKKQLCGNCALFIVTPQMKDCINSGVTGGERPDEWAAIDSAGELGYCEAFDFKCASKRTCRAWVVGGPITEEKENQVEEKAAKGGQENQISSWMNSMNDDEVDSLFPENEEVTDEEAKWMFGDEAESFKQSLMKRRKMRGGYVSPNMGMEEKAAKKPVLRDPKGGLTAAGRAHFNKTEGSNLKPGVQGPADTPEKMRRKGSFLTRFFTNPRGPMKDEKGRPTRLALSAAAWGEPVPQTVEAAKKLANKGQSLLGRYRRYKESSKGKKSLESFDFFIKELGAPVGQQSGTVGSRQPKPAAGGSQKPKTISGRGGGSSSSENYNPKARDMDGDGNVQEGTEFMRAADPRTETADSTDRRRRNAPPKNDSTDRRRRDAQRGNESRPPSTPAVAGTVDLDKRKPVTRPDGTTATVRNEQIVIGTADGLTTLIPTTGPNGEYWDPETQEGTSAAVAHYEKTDEHLGKFKTEGEAGAYSDWLYAQETSRTGQTSRTWQTDTGSADTRERGIIRENLEKMGFDGEAFRKLVDAESRKLKPGQKTNWNPGRLPNGGKIAADGTYIPPDMVREDDKRASDYYRERREARANASRPKITREGDVVPDKNRDRIPPKKTTTRTGSADSMERNTPKAPRTGTADSMERNAPRTPRTGTADSMERNAPRTPRTGTADSMERNAPRTPRTGTADSMERDAPKAPRTGTADAQGRRAEAEERRRTGKGQGFDKLETEAEVNAYRESYGLPPIKPKSPSGGRTGSADSQERTSSTSRRPNVQVPTTSDGTIIPNKNTDRRKPKPKGPTPLEDFI